MDEPLTISISLSLRIIALFYCLIQPVPLPIFLSHGMVP